MRSTIALLLLASVLALMPVLAAHADPWPGIEIPPQNARAAASPTPRPSHGDLDLRARHLVDALRSGAPDRVEAAMDFFLPREPFLAIKDMAGAAGYFSTLTRAYRHDIEAYRQENPTLSGATFARFELSRSCTWMSIGREANRLPYWSCYRSRIVLNNGGRELSLPVHVIINWGERWYVTHLRPWRH